MAKLSDEKLQREIEAAMSEEEYSIDDFYKVYTRVLSLSMDMRFDIVNRNYFRDMLKRWSNEDDSWLIKKGSGKKIRYHKWICHRSHMTRKQIHQTVDRMREGNHA